VIAGTNIGDDTFPVTVAANRRSFVVTDPDAPPAEAQPNKNAILNVLVYKNLKKDDANRAVLAKATMRRLRRDAEPVS
jgi:hypothetical protein